MTDTTPTTTTSTQTYILYRTAPLMFQPAASYIEGIEKPVASSISSPVGCVVQTMKLSGTVGLDAPAGFAYALDAAGDYPVGSVYTPPAE